MTSSGSGFFLCPTFGTFAQGNFFMIVILNVFYELFLNASPALTWRDSFRIRGLEGISGGATAA